MTAKPAKRLRISLRADLTIRAQPYHGQTHYVVKDPVGMRYFRFREEEYFLLRRLDGNHSLKELKEAYESEFPPQQITVEELARFTSQLAEAGLVQVDAPRQGQTLYKRFRKTRFKKRLAQLSNILYIKLPGFDPERTLTRLLPYFRWVFHPAAIAATLFLWVMALLWLASHYDTFRARLPSFHSFFNWHNVFYFWVALGIVKVIHEFGHGLTCKHFGGECHEMGVLFLVLSPCMYCDVSDSWLLPDKWRRVWISVAGIYVELTIAAIATFVWWNTEPGLLNNLCLSTMFICSVSTVLFNANPLLRFDGYYALMDMMEVPNLRAKAARFFQTIFSKYCLGLPAEMDPYLPRARRVFFFVYAVASYLYRWFISFAILWFLYRFLRPYKLGSISALLAAGALVTLLFVPLYQLGKFVVEHRRTSKVSMFRVSCTLAGVGILGALFCLLPLPSKVKSSFVVLPRNPELVYVEVEGVLEEQLCKDGDQVRAGQLLAVLRNDEKRLELEEALRNAEEHRVQAVAYRDMRDEDRRAEARIEEQLEEQFRDQASKVRADLDRLKLHANRSGTVMQPPEPEELGRLMNVGDLFCMIGDPRKLEARLVVDQSDMDLVQVGHKVRLKFYSHPLDVMESTVVRLAESDVRALPQELSTTAGGEVPTKTDPATGREVPLHTLYYAVVPVDDTDGLLQPGMRGQARIIARKQTLARRVWRWITRTFHFRV